MQGPISKSGVHRMTDGDILRPQKHHPFGPCAYGRPNAVIWATTTARKHRSQGIRGENSTISSNFSHLCKHSAFPKAPDPFLRTYLSREGPIHQEGRSTWRQGPAGAEARETEPRQTRHHPHLSRNSDRSCNAPPQRSHSPLARCSVAILNLKNLKSRLREEEEEEECGSEPVILSCVGGSSAPMPCIASRGFRTFLDRKSPEKVQNPFSSLAPGPCLPPNAPALRALPPPLTTPGHAPPGLASVPL